MLDVTIRVMCRKFVLMERVFTHYVHVGKLESVDVALGAAILHHVRSIPLRTRASSVQYTCLHAIRGQDAGVCRSVQVL